jgi:hypothetical protein
MAEPHCGGKGCPASRVTGILQHFLPFFLSQSV